MSSVRHWLSWFFFSSRRRHTRCALVTGVQTCALPIWPEQPPTLFDMATITPPSRAEHAAAAAAGFPRLRYMGSKYRLVPHLAELFAALGGTTALDTFSGSGVVSYTLQSLGSAVRSEGRRVGKECVSTWRSRWATYHENNTTQNKK